MSLVEQILAAVDSRLGPALREALGRPADGDGVRWDAQLVLVGHRASGKTRLLPLVAALTGRRAIDLDRELERRHGRPLREWLKEDVAGFRAAERECFTSLPADAVVAVGGGFLSLHADLLEGRHAVLVPVTFETYRERLLADVTRPRLRPELSAEEEIRVVFAERELLHARVSTVPLVELLRTVHAATARRVVTLPPELRGAEALTFAEQVRARGAQILELRNDLHSVDAFDVGALAERLPLLVAERAGPLALSWLAQATLIDHPSETTHGPVGEDGALLSHHALEPMRTEEALALWEGLLRGQLRLPWIKHVEPIRVVADGVRLLETQRALRERYPGTRVTVLAMGPLAVPFRCVLAERNALDYVATGGAWVAAPGQRLLDDAVREHLRAVVGRGRLGILGTGISGSRSPRIHAQPFDRLELPADAPVGELVEALWPYYRGFAVTSPFKRAIARSVGAGIDAVNTLYRQGSAGRSDAAAGLDSHQSGLRPWGWANTDVDGARAVLQHLGAPDITALGEGGVTAALRLAAADLGLTLRALKREHLPPDPLSGTFIWTWPAHLPAPEALRFADARVAVIAYGASARRIAAEVARLGGTPVRLGARWFVAQARGQRRLWEAAT